MDAAKTGWGEVAIDVVFDNKSIRRTFYVDEVSHRVYEVTFTPQSRGKHRVFVYLNGMEVKGSPFSLRIGKDIKEARSTNRSEAFKASTRMSGRYKKLEEQREEKRASYAEKEIFIEKPVAPPRSKREKRQSFKGFKEERQVGSSKIPGKLQKNICNFIKNICRHCSSPTTRRRTGWTCSP